MGRDSKGAAFAKTLFLALLAAMTLALWIEAASASAQHTVLCKENVSVCPEKSQYGSLLPFVSTVETGESFAKIELPKLTTISCGAGKIAGPLESHEEGPMTGHADTFWFSSCTPETCLVNGAEGFNFPWAWEAIGSGNGAVTISNVTMQISCSGKAPLKFNCKYEAGSLKAELEGGAAEKAFLRGEETTFSLKSGTGCVSSTVKLRFRTIVNEPRPTYVTN